MMDSLKWSDSKFPFLTIMACAVTVRITSYSKNKKMYFDYNFLKQLPNETIELYIYDSEHVCRKNNPKML